MNTAVTDGLSVSSRSLRLLKLQTAISLLLDRVSGTAYLSVSIQLLPDEFYLALVAPSGECLRGNSPTDRLVGK